MCGHTSTTTIELMWPHGYPAQMTPMKATHTPYRKFRLAEDEWKAYGEAVGDDQRSADLRAYIEWRVAHPDAELPKRPRAKRVAE